MAHDTPGLVFTNEAVPTAWPTRSRVDHYPWDFDASQRHTRLKTGIDGWPQAHYSVSAQAGWLGLGRAVYPFLPLVEQIAYATSVLKGSPLKPGPWSHASAPVATVRTGGIPWQFSQSPTASLGIKSG